MNLLSRRFAIAIAGMLGVTALVVAALTARPHRHDPCARPEVLSVSSLIPGARHTRTRDPDPKDRFSLWVEGTFANLLSAKDPFQYRIVRSYNVLGASLNPTNLVAPHTDAEHHRMESIEMDGTSIPVHVVEDYTKHPPQLIAYFQMYGVTPVSNPIATHLRSFRNVLRYGTPPVTTVIVNGPMTRADRPEVEEKVLAWLGGAWQFIDRFCAPTKKAPDQPS